jgi:hypothetical protein
LHVAAQVAPDGKVWMLEADAHGIVNAPPPQPTGYPVMPDDTPGPRVR